MHVQADAVGVGACATGRQRAIDLSTARQQDVAGHVGRAFPVGPAIGLDRQVRAGAQQVDVAANDGVIGALDCEVSVVLQRRDRAGEQEAIAALAQQRVRTLDAQLVNDAVVLGVVRVQHQLLARAVGDDPALGRVRTAVDRVVNPRQEERDEGTVARASLVIDRAGLEREAGLGEHGLLLSAVQCTEGHVGDAAAGHIVDHGRARRGGAEGDDRAAAVVSPKPVVDLEPVRLGRIDTCRMHAGLVDRRQESGHDLREVVSSAGLVHVVRAVDADRVALVGRDRHRGQVHTLAQHRHLDVAPADVLVLVVLAGALLEPQPVLLARHRLAAVVDEAIPADVARLLQHTVLLLSCQCFEPGTFDRLGCIAPFQAAVLVIGAFNQQGQHALGGVRRVELDEDLPGEHVVAQALRDDALLGEGEVLEARLRA